MWAGGPPASDRSTKTSSNQTLSGMMGQRHISINSKDFSKQQRQPTAVPGSTMQQPSKSSNPPFSGSPSYICCGIVQQPESSPFDFERQHTKKQDPPMITGNDNQSFWSVDPFPISKPPSYSEVVSGGSNPNGLFESPRSPVCTPPSSKSNGNRFSSPPISTGYRDAAGHTPYNFNHGYHSPAPTANAPPSAFAAPPYQQKSAKGEKTRRYVSWDPKNETKTQIRDNNCPVNSQQFRTKSKEISLLVLKRWQVQKHEKLVQFMTGVSVLQLREILGLRSAFHLSLCTDKEYKDILRLLKDGRFDQNPAFQESGLRNITFSFGRKRDREWMLKKLLQIPGN